MYTIGTAENFVIDADALTELKRRLISKMMNESFSVDFVPNVEEEFDQASIIQRDGVYRISTGGMWEDKTDMRALLAVFHEMGHAIDCELHSAGNWRMYCKKDVIERESDAWVYAVEVAHAVGFNYWDAFESYAALCLGTYSCDPFFSVTKEKSAEYASKISTKISDHRK